jgi:IS30 family transposase
MIERKRTPLSATQRVEVWRRWKAGESLHAIGRALGKDHVVVHLLLKRHGGIAPIPRRRSPRMLTLAEREDISRGIATGCSMRAIAQGLSRACSTVSREVARHGGRAQYRANEADQQAWESALRPKLCLLAMHDQLRKMVASKLILDWSPKQISGWLKRKYPKDQSLRVSHETIYRSLFIQARGALKKALIQHLRSKRRIRRSRHSVVRGQSRGQIVDAISIRERPAEIEDRAVPGHWEGDLLRGAGNSQVATLVERQSRFCMLVQVPSKYSCCNRCPKPARSQTPRDAAALVNLGPWVGDGAAQELQRSHQCESLFLRSAESLAARHEREYQRAATTVLAQESRSVSLHAIGPGQNSPASESTAARDLGF